MKLDCCRVALWGVVLLGMSFSVQAQQYDQWYQRNVVMVQFEEGVHKAHGNLSAHHGTFGRAAAPYEVEAVERVFPFLDHVEPTPTTARNLMALRRTWYVRYRADADPRHVSRVLAQVNGVAHAEPVLIARTFDHMVEPNDSLFGMQSYLKQMQLPQAWDVAKGSDGSTPVVIAIVDGGGDWRHEDLVANVWTNADEIPGNDIDDDGNDFVDDVHGINLANGDDTNNDPTASPNRPVNMTHGTRTAGVASAVTNNGIGIAGAAWNAQLMHINVACPDGPDGFLCSGFEGMVYAAANGADIINCSWGGYAMTGDQLNIVNQVLELSTDMGALVIASVGGRAYDAEKTYLYPARHPRVLSVGATERDSRQIAPFSDYGRTVSVFAPGMAIMGTVPGNGYSGYSAADGTSFSAALVSGTAALVKTVLPDISADELREQVRMAAESMDTDNPSYASELGRGYVNAFQAVQLPTYPAVRLKQWSLEDSGGDGRITSGEEVTVKMEVVNYLGRLVPTQDLTVALMPDQPYPYLQFTTSEVVVGALGRDETAELTFSFTVAADAPDQQRVRLFTRITHGSLEDTPDMIAIGINERLRHVHDALSLLYLDTDGDQWYRRDNWDITTVPTLEEFQKWYGVWMPHGWLQELNLNANRLSGRLPSELGSLSNLEGLNMNENELVGNIPAEFGELTQLSRLLLAKNALSGPIPPELSRLSHLQTLHLGVNTLSGTIPSELGGLSRLTVLALYSNTLSGAIPPELGGLPMLEVMDLYANDLSGTIPSELGDLSSLFYLDLGQNSLSGSIPPEIGNLSELEMLGLHINELSGAIPAELGNLSKLTELWAEQNKLSGTIPPELGRLSKLQSLGLRSNELTGVIPPELGDLSSLLQLRLSRNELTGSIPSELGNLSDLQHLELRGNKLTGSIPSELGNLSDLRVLLLNVNGFSGAIPPELGDLSSLEILYLNANSLSGEIPSALGNLAALIRLLAQENELTGMIPPELGNLERLQYLDLSRNMLSGVVPAELGNMASLRYLYLDGNNLEGKLPRSLMLLDSLQVLKFGDQALCAPQDNEFQQWFGAIADRDGPDCTGLYFPDRFEDQVFTKDVPIADLTLPEAQDGTAPYTYVLSPALPPGLTFDSATRMLSGIPSETMEEVAYKYTVTDAAAASDSMFFSMEVVSSPLSREGQDELPGTLVLHSNYPNPFLESTSILMDLPEPADVSITITDMLGRTVRQIDSVHMQAGRHRALIIDGTDLSVGPYPYRVVISTKDKTSVRGGLMIRM